MKFPGKPFYLIDFAVAHPLTKGEINLNIKCFVDWQPTQLLHIYVWEISQNVKRVTPLSK
jgi:hypothetical protein